MTSQTDVDIAATEAAIEIERRLLDAGDRLDEFDREHAQLQDSVGDRMALMDARHSVHRALAAIDQLIRNL